MTRRDLLALLPATALRAQDTPIHYREYARILPDYLTALAAEAHTRRNARLAALTSPAAIRDYQAWARRTFLQLAGPLPERTPLNLRITAKVERPAYTIEKVVYESRPGLYVTANFYVPKSGAAPFPGVLFQLGHATDGKSYPLYQKCCQGLVQLGYLVLAFDPMGQGERTNYPRAGGWLTRLSGGADGEHTVPGRQMLLTGETATGMQLWDAIRSLDVLAADPRVDPRRLASTGQSGGATVTMFLAAADDRLACAAVSSGNTENFATVPFYPPGSTDDAEQDFVGAAPLAFDRWDTLWPFAPKPLLVSVSARDYFGTYSPSYEASRIEEFPKLAAAWKALDAADRLKYADTPLPHGLSYDLRLQIYNWFERWLKPSRTPRAIEEEPPTAPEAAETLWCGPTGNTIRDFHGKTPYALTAERARAIRTPDAIPDLRKLLAVDQPPASPDGLRLCGRTKYRDCEVLGVEYHTTENVYCPAWLFLPRKTADRFVLILEPNGRNGRWHEDDLYHQIASTGIAVCAADLRGIGDLEPQFSPGAAGYERSHQAEEDYAWAGLMLGKPLLGQRVADILGIIRATQSAYSITVAARDKMTVPALCAAALEPRITRLYLCHGLSSWRSLVESETYNHPLANFIPSVLAATDLPQISRSIAPRPVLTGDAWDVAAITRT